MSTRILLVEDDDEIADFIERGLREESYRVDRANDGHAARHALETSPWDLVILDWWLPGPDGAMVLREMRARDRATPVLFLTARDSIADRVEGLEAGADDYLCKPFAFDELLARVRALLRRRAEQTGPKLEHHDLSLFPTAQRAERAGRVVDLTAKEFRLLEYFMRHPGEVLSRTRIYEAVWDDRYDGLSNTLEVHIVELRRKLEAFGPRLIQTVRGRGYLLGDPSAPEPS